MSMSPIMRGQSENAFRSSSSGSLYNAASQFFLTSNYSPTHLLSEDEDEDDIGEEEDLSAQSSPREVRSPELPRASNEDTGNSEDKSDLDGDSLESPNNNQTPVFSSLRGSLHSQIALQPSDLTIPKSRYIGYEPPLSVCKEKVAVQELQDAIKQQKFTNPAPETKTGGDYANSEEFELSHFAVYLPADNKWHPCEMRGLQHLATKQGHGSFYFDGILSAGGLKRYVQGVPFKICPIGGYGPENHEVGRDIWIKSDLNSKSKANIYYRLGAPASEYARFHEGFLWLANLAKHFVDFCEACEDPISIHNFRSDFHTWLEDTHGTSSRFRSWYQKYDNEDFSRAVVANVNFLFKESIGVNEELRSQPIWSETMERDSIPYQQIQEKQTVVTPYVYECFKDIIFGHHLLPIEPSSISKMQHTMRGRALDLSTNSLPTTKPDQQPASQISIEIPDATAQFQKLRKEIQNIGVGSVLSVIKDGQGSVWKDEVSRWKAATDNDCWYVYVQGIHESKNGQRSFHCIWLYSPADTMCALMKYPWPNELFLSDNCTCTGRRIKEDEILDVVSIQWHGNPAQAGLKLFIRQTYLENERFVTLKEAHKKCEHLKNREQIGKSIETTKHPIGQTLLVPPTQKSRHELESYEIIRYITEGSKEFAILRWLQRRRDIDGTGKANELVYTNKTDQVITSKLHGTCLVRFYSASDVEKRRIPAPYSRDGTGNAFYITKRLVQVGDISKMIPIEEDLPITLIQGFDPASSPPRNMLRGIDLYCGGGNFGRGIEEGGSVHNEWAVDINRNAIHTYAANLKEPTRTKLFYGSVDDLLTQALQGNPQNSELIPSPGDVDFLSAGSPCQGFSKLNIARNNDNGLKNQSLVASVAAYVDFYRPKYGLLENVMAMAQKGDHRDKDVLSQLICTIVGMGYQLQLFVLDAWSCGSPQSRTRLFVTFAAPGLEPLGHPQLSHSHPPKVTDRALGKLANGESYGWRLRGPTPFEFVTAWEATKDLPRISDGCTYQCTKEPDHVTVGISTELRSQIRTIPTFPRGMNFSKAWNEGRGVMAKEQRDLFPNLTKDGKPRENTKTGSRAWGRVHPKGLFPTIVVGLYASDSRLGNNLHWDDHRYLTTMEARRAQGFPDNEVLLGTPADGWKLMGNSVARSVALALGLSLREAWLKNDPDDEPSSNKANNSLPVLHEQKLDRRSGIQVVIPAMARRSKRELGPTEASVYPRTTVHAEQDSRNLVNPSNPTVTPHKSRRASFVPQSELLASREDGPSIDFVARTVSANTNRRSRVIPDSAEASANEESISEDTFQRFVGSLALKTPSSRDEQGKPTLLKRPHHMLQQYEGPAMERTRKVPRVIIPSTSSSSIPGSRPSYSRPKTKPVNPTTLANKLKDIKWDQDHREAVDFSDNGEDGEFDVEVVGGPSSTAQSSSVMDRNRSRTAPQASRGKYKAPRKGKPKKPVLISLLSEDEDEDELLGATAGPPSRPLLSSSSYVPVDNSNLIAYAQTNRVLHQGKDRKRVVVR